MNEKERNEKEATDKASEAAASLSQFAAKPIKVMSSCRGRLRWGWEWGGCCLAMIWGWQTQPHTQSTRAEPARQPLPRQTKPNPNPSQTRHGQVLYALRVRSISCLGHVLDSDSDLPWLEWRLVDFNSLFHSLRLCKTSHVHWGGSSDKKCVKLCVTGDTPPNAKQLTSGLSPPPILVLVTSHTHI